MSRRRWRSSSIPTARCAARCNLASVGLEPLGRRRRAAACATCSSATSSDRQRRRRAAAARLAGGARALREGDAGRPAPRARPRRAATAPPTCWSRSVADPRGFVDVRAPGRAATGRSHERLGDHRDQAARPPTALVREQAARCMGCGVPFCHTGCPLGNLVPDWNELVRTGRWREARDAAARDQQLPRVHRQAVPGAVRGGVRARAERRPGDDQADRAGDRRARVRRGLGAAAPGRRGDRAGRWRSSAAGRPGSPPPSSSPAPATRSPCSSATSAPGGLLRFGIPDFKLEKWLVDRRVDQLVAEGVRVRGGVDRRRRRSAPTTCAARFDAVLLATGAQRQRDARPARARACAGVEPAMAYLTGRNRRVAGRPAGRRDHGRRASDVVVLGGGDTSADCLGCALREGARSVTEIAHGPTPPAAAHAACAPGPSGRSCCAPTPPTRRAASASGRSSRRRSRADGGVRRCAAGGWTIPASPASGRGRSGADRREAVFAADLVLVAIGFAGVERRSGLRRSSAWSVAAGTVAAGAGGATGVARRVRRGRLRPRRRPDRHRDRRGPRGGRGRPRPPGAGGRRSGRVTASPLRMMGARWDGVNGSAVAGKIRSRLGELSPNDRRIARQILDNDVEAPFETAESLAAKAGVSKAAVVRFATRVGFAGFTELHEALRAGGGRSGCARAAASRRRRGGVLERFVDRARADLDATRGEHRPGRVPGRGAPAVQGQRQARASSATASRSRWPSTPTTC